MSVVTAPLDGRASPRVEPAAAEHTLIDDTVATLALLGYSLAVAAGFARVFSGWDFFDNLAVIAVVGHGLSLVLRRLRVSVLLAFPLLVLVTIWLIGAMFYRETYALGLPTSDTWEAFRTQLDLVSEQFRTAVAPVVFLSGWDVLAAIGMGAVVVLSDTFAFRAYARAEALVPGGVLFVFVAALGSDRGRVASTVLLVAAGVVATAVLRSHHATDRPTAIGRRRSAVGWILPVAIVTAVAVGLLAGFVGPRLPGADAEPLYETKGGSSGGVTTLQSPLVDIRSRLTNQGVVELFTVESPVGEYWRSSSLPEFDGTIWKLPDGDLERIPADPPDPQTDPPGSLRVQQSVTVSALAGPLVPAAADPVAAAGTDGLRLEPFTGALVKTGDGVIVGDRIDIVSVVPRFTPEQLRSATSTSPGDPIFFELPDDFPLDEIRAATVDVVGTDPTPFDAALRLENWMQAEFEYSTEVQAGHSNNLILEFLDKKIGYCEQFAGTYAAMMRSVGIPSRVSVGFTQGDFDDATARFSVRGRNAHAWPEVWFDGLGWVPFEPTPGRGNPAAVAYTGREPEQEDGPLDLNAGDGSGDPQQIPGPEVTAPSPTLPGQTSPTTIPDLSPNFGDQFDSVDGEAGAAPTTDDSSPWPWIAAAVIALAVLLTPFVVRRVRRRASRDPDVEIRRLWARATTAVAAAGVDVRASRTPIETAEITTVQFPTASRPMNALAEAVSEAVYGADGTEVLVRDGTYGSTLLGNCSVWCRQIEKAVSDSLSPTTRAKRYFTNLT